jgi:Kef-type K+ transport system membrane component KefB
MVDLVTQVFAVLFVGSILGWFFKRFFYSSFIGYVVGGFITSSLFMSLGSSVSQSPELEFLRSLGLIIFSFEAGLSIGIGRLLRSLNKVLVIELASYPLLWVSARVIAGVVGLGIVGEALLFLTLIDSSSTSITLAKTLQSEELRALAIVETNFEDLAQFIAFSMIFVAGISRPTIESVAVSVLKVVGLLAFLAYTLLRVMRRLRVFVSRMDPGSKYLLFLSIALLYSVVVQGLGLPPLLGAFIAGVVLSEYAGSEELTIISGVRELGLLLYFSSLGTQLTLPQYSVSTPQLLAGALIGVTCVLIRIAALSLASTMGALNPGSILPYAAALSSISETAIVFSDALISRGAAPTSFRALTVLAVATSMLVSPVVYRRSLTISEVALPKKVRDITSSISSLLLHSSNLIVEVGGDMVRFLATLLAVVYALHIAAIASKYIPVLGALLVTTSMVVGYVITTTSFARTLRKMYSKALGEIAPVKGLSLREAAAKFVTVTMTALSVALLITTLHTILTEAGLPTQLYTLLTVTINATAVTLLIYIALKELRKARKHEALPTPKTLSK